MATLATLDPAKLAALEAFERQSGAWLLAYTPAASSAAPPAFTTQLRPASLPKRAVQRLQSLEQATGALIIAYQPVPPA